MVRRLEVPIPDIGSPGRKIGLVSGPWFALRYQDIEQYTTSCTSIMIPLCQMHYFALSRSVVLAEGNFLLFYLQLTDKFSTLVRQVLRVQPHHYRRTPFLQIWKNI